MPKILSLRGEIFGSLTVLRQVENTHNGRTQWLCKCDCGNETFATTQLLRRGTKRSCGCLMIGNQNAAKHNRSHSPEYQAWANLKDRCINVNSKSYSSYGGRGIQVCQRWFDSFDSFFEDMGPKPSSDHSIDRIDNSGHYEPSNCRWATRSQQQRNKG